MALSTLFVDINKRNQKLPRFNLQYSTDPRGVNQYLESQNVWYIDASIQETYNHEADMTSNPVEKGLNVTDHYNVKPIEITMKMVHSETPIGIDSLIKGGISGIGQFAGSQIFQGGVGREIGALAPAFTRIVSKESDAKTRVATCYQLFKTLMDTKSTMTIQTGLSLYTDLMIRSMTVNRDKGTGQSLDFTVVLRQVRFVESSIISVPKITVKKISDRASGKTDLGKQSSKPLSAETTKTVKNQSALFEFFGGQ